MVSPTSYNGFTVHYNMRRIVIIIAALVALLPLLILVLSSSTNKKTGCTFADEIRDRIVVTNEGTFYVRGKYVCNGEVMRAWEVSEILKTTNSKIYICYSNNIITEIVLENEICRRWEG